MMVSKGNRPQLALIQVGEFLQFTQIENGTSTYIQLIETYYDKLI